MTDYELSNYLPVHGDRLRLRKHLKQEPGKKKRQLLQILQEKLNKAKKGKKKKDNTSSAEEEEEYMRRYQRMRRDRWEVHFANAKKCDFESLNGIMEG